MARRSNRKANESVGTHLAAAYFALESARVLMKSIGMGVSLGVVRANASRARMLMLNAAGDLEKALGEAAEEA